jgi:hypothetical protein
MSLPDNAEFRALLSSLSIVAPSEGADYGSVEAIPAGYALDGSRKIFEEARRIWFKSSGQMQWESLVKRIQAELIYRGHKSKELVVYALLCVYCLDPEKSGNPVESLNWILDKVVSMNLTQFYILPGQTPAEFHRFTFGEFTIGTLNADRLESRSRKAGSDYYLRDYKHLFGRLTVERNSAPGKMLDWRPIKDSISRYQYSKSDWSRFVEAYYWSLSNEYWDEFWEVFFTSQSILIAAGAPVIRPRLFQMIRGAVPVSIFLSEEWGHVSPGFVDHLTIDLLGVDKKFPATAERLKREYGFEGFASNDLHRTLQAYASFVARAELHLAEANLDEAFLHYVIALDLVFGGEQSIAQTVSERVAMIVYRPIGMSFRDAVSAISKAYGVRSKYVHEGRPVKGEMIDQIKVICREVLHCLLRVQRSNDMGIDQWLSNLDYFVASVEANRAIANEELNINGIR